MLAVPFPTWVTARAGGKRPKEVVNYFAESKRTVPDFARNQELFGGDYWTRTSVLLRVKIRMDVKGLRLGVFRQFLPHFLQAQYLPSPLRPPAYFLILVKGPAPPNLAEPGLFHEAK